MYFIKKKPFINKNIRLIYNSYELFRFIKK